MRASAVLSCLVAGLVLLAAEVRAQGPTKVSFEMHRVGSYRGEACGVADFNDDGKPDIVALPYLYLAPDFKPIEICKIAGEVDDQGKGYRWDFMNAPLDVDGDGLLDIVTCSWHGKRCEWLRNPGATGGLWPRVLVEENGNYECGELMDINGDGEEDEILPSTTDTIYYELATGADGKRNLVRRSVSTRTAPWGGGAGDVNGDGRCDLLRPDAWFEAPAKPDGQWAEHPWALGNIEEGRSEHTPQILVHDVNGDGLNDIVTSSAHRYGIFWYQQIRNGDKYQWKQHVIDKTWTQAHSLTLADFDGDGDLDLVTGKRFMAHNGNDPGGNEPPCVYWYEVTPGRTVKWTRHAISVDQGIGSGMNIPVVDMDGDGDLDIVVTGKWGGPVWFENKLK